MYNQVETILEQYEIEINQVTKGRGAYICDTNQGMKLLTGFRGSKERGEFLSEFLRELKENGFEAEQIYFNKEGMAVTTDELTEEHFILKDYIAGTELNTSSFEEMKHAAELLAIYHNATQNMQVEPYIFGKENEKMITEIRKRHYREFVKVRNYIRNRKKKSEFERIYMEHYEVMSKKAKESVELLETLPQEELIPVFCHGDYNQHNIVLKEDKRYLLNFETVNYSFPMTDLANYIRKMLEKNNWDTFYGMQLIASYDKIRPISKTEYKQLYALLLFPEKFWKVTNHYMNSHKAWISARDIEKVEKVIAQEENRTKFLESLFSFVL
ncbi:MAG: phosphotransferase [Lachnospiraceae bacterium]|nr:phosphotransferase [Lachnospiraceae bacterium]